MRLLRFLIRWASEPYEVTEGEVVNVEVSTVDAAGNKFSDHSAGRRPPFIQAAIQTRLVCLRCL